MAMLVSVIIFIKLIMVTIRQGYWYSTLSVVLSAPLMYLSTLAETMTNARPSRHCCKQTPVINGRPRARFRCIRGRLTIKVMVLSATTAAQNHASFDTDSARVGVDNICPGCISHKVTDFIGELVDCNRTIKGFGGTRTTNIKMGKTKWSWLDDEGMVNTHHIPNSYYAPEGGVRLLSPHHLDQASKDPTDTGEDTNGVQCTLYWNKKKQKLTIPIDSRNNCVIFQLAPGYESYCSFCLQAEILEQDQDEILCHLAETIFDKETEMFVPYCPESTGWAI